MQRGHQREDYREDVSGSGRRGSWKSWGAADAVFADSVVGTNCRGICEPQSVSKQLRLENKHSRDAHSQPAGPCQHPGDNPGPEPFGLCTCQFTGGGEPLRPPKAR